MLLIPCYAPLGAAGLATMMVGKALRDLTQQHPSKAVAPILLTLLLIVVGYARRPPGYGHVVGAAIPDYREGQGMTLFCFL